MLEKARQEKHGNHPTILSRWYEQEGYRKSLGGAQCWRKRIMLYDRIALKRRDCTATRAERRQNTIHRFLRLNADGPQKLLRQRPEFADASRQCLKMQDAHLAETEQTLIPTRPQHQRVNDKISNSKEEKTSITMSIARLDGGITESHRETRQQHPHLHLQLRSGRLRNGKRVGAHGNIHHLRSGDFGFLERIPENRRVCVDSTPIKTAHTAKYSLFTSAERIARAWLNNRITSLCA